MDEVSATEIRRVPSGDLEDSDVGGMLEDDTYGHATAGSNNNSGSVPAAIVPAAMLGHALNSVKAVLHKNGVGKQQAAEMLGRVAAIMLADF